MLTFSNRVRHQCKTAKFLRLLRSERIRRHRQQVLHVLVCSNTAVNTGFSDKDEIYRFTRPLFELILR